MKKCIVFCFIFLILLFSSVALADSDFSLLSDEEKLQAILSEENFGYDIAFFSRVGSTMRSWDYYLVDFDRQCMTEMYVTARKGDSSGYRSISSIITKTILGTMLNGWSIKYSNGTVASYLMTSTDSEAYVERSINNKVTDSYLLVDTSEAVSMLENGLVGYSSNRMLKCLLPSE